MRDLFAILKENAYPGRGIVLGRTPDGARAVIAYFIMGRSANSRNRVFAQDGDALYTRAFDESKVEDPSLIIYAPIREVTGRTIVTNGDQTDTIYVHLTEGKSFPEALRTRTFEPDAPHYTPRISGLLETNGDYTLSILKSADGNPASCHRFFYEYEAHSGVGHFIHTYQGNAEILQSFSGEPMAIVMEDDVQLFTENLWQSLNEENKIALFVQYRNLETGETDTIIKNRHMEA